MYAMIRTRLTGVRGFTFTELVVVLVILGLLIALALPSYLGARKRTAQEEARRIGQEWRTLAWSCYLLNSSTASCGSSSAIGFSEKTAVHWQFATGTYTTTASTIQFTVKARSDDPMVAGEAYTITLTVNGAGAGTASDSFSGP